MSDDAPLTFTGIPFHIRSTPDGCSLHRPKQKPTVKQAQTCPLLAPLPSFCRLSGSIQRLGGSAFSAFKPLLARTCSHREPRPTPRVSSNFTSPAASQVPHADSTSCSPSSEHVATSRDSSPQDGPNGPSPAPFMVKHTHLCTKFSGLAAL